MVARQRRIGLEGHQGELLELAKVGAIDREWTKIWINIYYKFSGLNRFFAAMLLFILILLTKMELGPTPMHRIGGESTAEKHFEYILRRHFS
jgi:hypothetical protein